MKRVARYLRGSGRVLAFVFTASVVWLLFDMAALRLSITDVSSSQERVIRDGGSSQQQRAKVTRIMREDPPGRGGSFETPQGHGPDSKVRYVRAGVQRSDDLVLPQQQRSAGSDPEGGDSHKQPEKEVLHLDLNRPQEEERGVRSPVEASDDVKPGDRDGKDEPKVPEKKVPEPKVPEKKVPEPKVPEKKVPEKKVPEPKTPEKHDIKVPEPKVPEKKVPEPKIPEKKIPEPKVPEKKVPEPKVPEKKVPEPKIPEKKVPEPKVPERKDLKSKDLSKEEVKSPQVKGSEVETGHKDRRAPEDQVVRAVEVDKEEPGIRPVPDSAKRQLLKPTVQVPAKEPGVHKVLSLDVTHAPRDANAVGQFGQAGNVPNDKKVEAKSRWNEGHFNVYLSDQIPVDRAVPDTRPEMCAENLVHDDLPSTSVIFCFVDEVWSTLLRSVHSVLNRSPPHLLKEIILVDDFSTKDYLKQQLDDYMSQFPKVRIIRLKERQGLIRARLAGAAVAKGDVLTFLDSHVECNVGWLEPLLERVYLDRRKVPCPVIEVINDKDMSYMLVDNFQRGVFKWPLVFGWSALTDEYIRKNNMSIADPIRCPVMAGGLFSIDKKYFYELGAYDPGLDVWGGENMEISFKIWMCGGEIEIIPCSRVGHIFRGQNPYKFPKDRQKTVERNLARVAEVWLDEYKDLFYGHGYYHLLDKNVIDVGDLTAQIELRKRLKCQSFRWYLENVYPEMEAHLMKAEGLIFNLGLRKCLILQQSSLSFQTCNLTQQSQHFNYTWMKHVRQRDVCVAPRLNGGGGGLTLGPCDNSKPELRWSHKSSDLSLVEHFIAELGSHQMCLEAEPQGDGLRLRPCDAANALQRWQFTIYYSH